MPPRGGKKQGSKQGPNAMIHLPHHLLRRLRRFEGDIVQLSLAGTWLSQVAPKCASGRLPSLAGNAGESSASFVLAGSTNLFLRKLVHRFGQGCLTSQRCPLACRFSCAAWLRGSRAGIWLPCGPASYARYVQTSLGHARPNCGLLKLASCTSTLPELPGGKTQQKRRAKKKQKNKKRTGWRVHRFGPLGHLPLRCLRRGLKAPVQAFAQGQPRSGRVLCPLGD